MALIAEMRSKTPFLGSPTLSDTMVEGRKDKLNGLETEQANSVHKMLFGHYNRELARQEVGRAEMAMDEDFVDHIQWTDDEITTLVQRGQTPTVFNLTAISVFWLLGSQRRSTMDWRILPRRKDGIKHAETKTELMKYVEDGNNSTFHQSKAFRDAVIAGVGWLETGQGEEGSDQQVFDRSESWRNMIHDTTSTEHDFSDGRYLFRTKWMDADIMAAMWPSRVGLIEHSINRRLLGGSYGLELYGDWAMDSLEEAHFDFMGGAGMTSFASRSRVRAIECWFTKPTAAPIMKGGQFSGQIFDEYSPGHWLEIKNERASLAIQPRRVMHCAMMTEHGLLDLKRSPYRHNRFPFTPVWGNRRARDGMPYGLVRGLRDINRDLNKRASKSLHILSSTRTFVEKGSVSDIEVLRDEVARPDAVVEYNEGKGAPVVVTDQNLSAAHMQLLSFDASMIQQVSGVTGENLGHDTNARSGKAIIAKQDQGAMTTSHYFENLRIARKVHGEKILCNIEQFFTDEFEFRITNQRGNPEYRTINGDKMQGDDAIASTRADFTVSEDDWRATYRQRQAELLLDLMTKLAATSPEIVIKTLDLVVETLDVPRAGEIVKRIRQITGMADPDADPNNPDPETTAMQQQRDAAAAMQQRAADAEIAGKEAKAKEVQARADKITAETRILAESMTDDEIQRLRDALSAAVEIAGAKDVAHVADQVLAQAKQSSQPQPGQIAANLPPQGAIPQPQQPPMTPDPAQAMSMPSQPATMN